MANILVIEDSRDNREITSMILRSAGHTVMSAADGPTGLAAAGSRPDLILMDLALPRLDGWEATRRLKANPITRDIPVIAFTAHLMKEDIERAKEAGCAAVVAKPFAIDTLLEQINRFLGVRGGNQDDGGRQARSAQT